MYPLDTNVFIEAKNRYYGFELCPGFWEWLERAEAAGDVASIERVFDELAGSSDELEEWARGRGDTFFLTPDEQVVASLRQLTQWVMGAGYPQGAVSAFFDAADYYPVAHAHAHGMTVVTHERPGATKTVKIPDACAALGVRFVDTFAMLRREHARFVLA